VHSNNNSMCANNFCSPYNHINGTFRVNEKCEETQIMAAKAGILNYLVLNIRLKNFFVFGKDNKMPTVLDRLLHYSTQILVSTSNSKYFY
jgi:hypothetical protein